MKKTLSLLLTVLLLLTALPMSAVSFGVSAEEEEISVIVNVKDFGAVGDGKTDDRDAIMNAFYHAMVEYMNYDIPVTVYFPEGQYGLLNGGMYIYMPRGFGNLTVKGDGADKSTIVYLDEWDNSGSWVALRIYPRITPTTMEEYLHDITIEDLGIYDTDPVKHAWHPDKGDPGKEETHGFNIQHCIRATIRNCKVDSVGDEAIDMSHCIDSVMTDNLVINSPGAGSAGGAISVGDGSKNVSITNNTVIGTIDNPAKTNWAIAIEALTEHIEGITVTNNAMQDIAGYGINIGAPAGTIADVLVQNNTIYHCRDGGIRFMGDGKTTGVEVRENTISNVKVGILIDGKNKEGILIDSCAIDNLSSYAVRVVSPQSRDTVVQNTTITNAKWRAIYNAGTNTKMDRLWIDGVGTSGGVTDSAIIQYTNGGSSELWNSVILNCQNKVGVQGVKKVVNTLIEQPETSGYASIQGANLIQNCKVNRIVKTIDGSTVDGVVLYTESELGTHAILLVDRLNATVTNCIVTLPSRYGISESGTSDNNTITNNVCVGGSGIKTIGANTVATGNVQGTAGQTEQFKYRLVDGVVTILAPVDATVAELEIPAAIEGYPVVGIDPWAFALCRNLTTVTLPAGIATIGNHAFYGCDSLQSVRYRGDEMAWADIAIGEENDPFTTAARICRYSDPGDMDGDGAINNKDLGLLQQYLNNYPIEVFEVAADTDGNGKANNRDLGLLQRYLAGWDVTLG